MFRIGHGYDIHRTGADGELVLGGVRFPGERALVGHSDGDAAVHAVIDALLGAAGLGDIGRLFPPGEARWRGADSLDLLGEVTGRVRAAGYAPVNIDLTIIAERPRLAPQVGAMCAAIAAATRLESGAVNVKAKTNEGLDAVGRGEAIAAHAVALVARRDDAS